MSREFFMLPLEEKQKYPMAPGTVQGYGQAFVFSEDQKLDWCNMFALGIEPHYVRNPNLWPRSQQDSVQAIRMNYYPPCSRPDLVLGLSPHSDGSALTVLQQAKGSPVGLQILKGNNGCLLIQFQMLLSSTLETQ
ncbi:Oxoglutarate/iron-dependent dioxygenase [Sesbania bispinosa]|nr:Oxoglutarate/iron-dependent dioxygenase [Sesbania bispinosa]